jgi:1-acyl-sn-glycerol-3-phosphate acyltransferase
MNGKSVGDDLPPPITPWLMRGFRRVSHHLLRRHFHVVATHREALTRLGDLGSGAPVLVYGNHPSWWDPLIAMLLCERCMPERRYYAPIDARMLRKYRVFGQLGYFGVELSSTRGAAAFLRRSKAILETPRASLWLTPEGRFTDPRDRSVPMMPGLAHLASKLQQGTIVPLALEYTFWEERLPEMLSSFGKPIRVEELAGADKAQWQEHLEESLRRSQDELAQAVISRQASAFQVLLQGGRGAGALYDWGRRVRAWGQGRRADVDHGEHFH